jgi:branched-chain amino acid transport system substrate-binding protein
MAKRRQIWIAIGVLFVIILALVATLPMQRANKEGLEVGVILPLSGGLAVLGKEVQAGIELGIEEANRTGLSLAVIYEDDESLAPTSIIKAANKLINVDRVDVVLTMLVEESRPIAPIFNSSKVPLVVLWDSNSFIKEAGEYVFSNGFSTENAGELMAEYAYLNLSLRKISIIRHIDPWAEIISESFEIQFTNLGGTIAQKESFSPEEADYRTALIKAKQLNVDGIYFPLIPPSSADFLIQTKQLGVNVTLLTGDALIQDVIDVAGGAAERVYFTNVYTDDKDKLTQKYKEKYGFEPIDMTLVSFGYDGVAKITEAVKTQKEIKDALASLFGENRSADRAEKIYKVVDGKPRGLS